MQTNTIKNRTYSLSFFKTLILGLVFALGVTSCGGGSSTPPTPIVNTVNANVAGYYTGTAAVKMSDNSTALPISDLRVFVNGSRIMAMGLTTDATNFVLYDIAISSISGNSYTAVATIYKAAVNIGTANVTGTITEGSSIAGTFTGSGIANGTFSVTYDTVVNARTASLSVIASTRYRGPLNTGNFDIGFDIDATGNVISSFPSINGIKIEGCNIVAGSSLTAIAGGNLYDLVFVLSGCNDVTVNGNYTGLITIFDDTVQPAINGFMPAAFANGSFAGTAVFNIN